MLGEKRIMKKEKRFFPSRAREILSSYFSEHEFLEFNEFFYGVSPKRSRKSYKNRFENLSKIYLRHDTPSFSSFAFHVFPACHRSCKPGIVLLERTSFVWTKAENESLSRRRLRTDCLLPDCYLPAEEFFPRIINEFSLAVFAFSPSVVCQAIGYRWMVGILQGRARLA